MMEVTDRELIARYRRGDVDAFETLVTRYRRPLFAYIMSMTQNAGESEDVFQDVWVRVMRKLRLYKQDNFQGWLMRIAHNMVIDRVRRSRPEVSLEQADGSSLTDRLASGAVTPGQRLEHTELGARIEEAVSRLPLHQKEVFALRLQAGLSFKDIARVQKVSINTALARMQYALSKLRPVLQEDYKELARAGGERALPCALPMENLS